MTNGHFKIAHPRFMWVLLLMSWLAHIHFPKPSLGVGNRVTRVQSILLVLNERSTTLNTWELLQRKNFFHPRLQLCALFFSSCEWKQEIIYSFDVRLVNLAGTTSLQTGIRLQMRFRILLQVCVLADSFQHGAHYCGCLGHLDSA
jgi:hypothetical protein